MALEKHINFILIINIEKALKEAYYNYETRLLTFNKDIIEYNKQIINL